VIYNVRQSTITFVSPENLTIVYQQYVANSGDTTVAPGAVGAIFNSTRATPRTAGFGSVNSAQTM
jgi:hypothetical protein